MESGKLFQSSEAAPAKNQKKKAFLRNAELKLGHDVYLSTKRSCLLEMSKLHEMLSVSQ